MAAVAEDRRYTEEHEWAQPDPDNAAVVIVGLTEHAQEQLGDIVMVELPEVGDTVAVGDVLGTVESPKAVSDVFAPIAGEVVAINEELLDRPELVNEDCYGAGWLLKLALADGASLDALMDVAAYEALLGSLDE